KVTLIAQLLPAPRVAGESGHVVVLAKSPALVPVTAMLLIVSAPGPLLVRVIACAALVVSGVCDATVSDACARPTVGAGATLVPLSATDSLLPVPVSVMLTAAVPTRRSSDVKVTLIAQLLPAPRVAGESGHVVVLAKSPALVPVTAMLLIVSAPGPLLVR